MKYLKIAVGAVFILFGCSTGVWLPLAVAIPLSFLTGGMGGALIAWGVYN